MTDQRQEAVKNLRRRGINLLAMDPLQRTACIQSEVNRMTIQVEEYTELDFEHVVLETPQYQTAYCHSCGTTTTCSQLDHDHCGICNAFVFIEE